MRKDPSVYIEDIIVSIDFIAKYVTGLSFEEFTEQIAVQDAVLRRLQIIAEAAKRIDRSLKEGNPLIPWAKINGLRNAIVHNYDEVDLKAIWETIKEDLPQTKEDFIKLKQSLSKISS